MVDEYVCVTVHSHMGETAEHFKKRLIDFWTKMLRTRPSDYESVYAESTQFESKDNTCGRSYLVRRDGTERIRSELAKVEIACDAVDLDDLYSKYEAASPDWFQIQH